MNTIQEERELARQAQEKANSQLAWYEFVKLHPELNCEANRRLMEDFHHGEPMTLQSLEESSTMLGNSLARKGEDTLEQEAAAEQARKDFELAQERQQLIDILVDDFSHDPFSRDNFRAKLQKGYESIDELRRRAQEVRDRRHYRSLSKEELRAVVRGEQPAALVLPAEWTKEAIRKTDTATLRKLMARYGSSVVNDRLAGRS